MLEKEKNGVTDTRLFGFRLKNKYIFLTHAEQVKMTTGH